MEKIEGRISDDGKLYQLWRRGIILVKSIPVEEMQDSRRHSLAIRRNRWEPLP